MHWFIRKLVWFEKPTFRWFKTVNNHSFPWHYPEICQFISKKKHKWARLIVFFMWMIENGRRLAFLFIWGGTIQANKNFRLPSKETTFHRHLYSSFSSKHDVLDEDNKWDLMGTEPLTSAGSSWLGSSRGCSMLPSVWDIICFRKRVFQRENQPFRARCVQKGEKIDSVD